MTSFADSGSASLSGWHPRSRDIATRLIQKHGPPDEVSAWRLAWRRVAPWTSTVVHREGTLHEWPTPHLDVIEQTIAHHLPRELLAEAVLFHGGISFHRTRGEVSVLCASPAANAAAVNLLHDILESRTSVARARMAFAKAFDDDPAKMPEAGYAAGPIFGRQVATADPDEPVDPATGIGARFHRRSHVTSTEGQ